MIFQIILLGLLLRLLALETHSFWFDEAITYHFAKLPVSDLLKAVSTDNNPPVYYLLMHFVQLISKNEIFLRMPSLLAGLLTIGLIYRLFGNKTNREPRGSLILAQDSLHPRDKSRGFFAQNNTTALLAAGLYSVSPLAVYIATEARLHSLAGFFAVLVIHSYLSVIKKPKLKEISVFMTVSILALHTQYYIALLFIPMTLALIFQKYEITLKKWLVLTGLCFLSLTPWLIFSLQTENNQCWCPNTFISLPAALVSPALSGVGIITLRSFNKLPFPYFLLFAASAAICIIYFAKGLFKKRLLSAIYMIPLICLSLAGFMLPVFSPKAFSIFSPFFFLITAQGLSGAPRIMIPCLIVLLGTTSVLQSTDPFFGGEQIKEAYILTKSGPSLPIYHTSLVTYYSFEYFSQKSTGPSGSNQKNILLTPNGLNQSTTNYIGGITQKVQSDSKNSWLVDIDKWTDQESSQKAKEELLRNFKIKQNFQAGQITIYFLER